MVRLPPWTVVCTLGLATLALVLASVAMKVLVSITGNDTMHGLVRFFNLNQEMNLPTWYSSTLLLFSSLVLAWIAVAERATGQRARPWIGLSIIFMILSIDEAASFHEIFIAPTRNLLGVSGVFYYAWVIPGLALVVITALSFVRWFRDLSARSRTLVFVAGVLFVGGAIGMEMVGGLLASRGERFSVLFTIVATLEETFEMCGVLLWIYALLDYAATRGYEIKVGFGRV